MLRSFGQAAYIGRCRFLREGLARAGRPVFMAVMMFILCRVRPVMNLAPFAVAFFAGALAAGENAGALLAGGIAGSLRAAELPVDLHVPVAAALVLGGGLVWDGLRKRLRLGTSPPGGSGYTCALLAGLGTLFPGLVAANGEIWPSVQAVSCAIAAAASAPYIQIAAGIKGSRKFLMREERIGAGILACGAVAGLTAICPPVAMGAAALLTVLMYPAGSLAAILLGGAVAAISGDARQWGVICLGGICSQLAQDSGRYARSGAAMLAIFTGALFFETDIPGMAGAVLGAGACALLPEGWLSRMAELARPDPRACDPDRLAAQLRGQASRKLMALSDAFGELAECYLRPCPSSDEQYLIARMRDRLCAGCPGYGQCWDSGSGAVRFLCGLVSNAVEWAGSGCEGGLFDEDMPPDVLRMCRRGRLVPERLEEMLADFALRRQSEKRRGSENRLISAQFLQAQQLLEGLAREQMRPVRLRNRQSERAAAILEGMGIPLSEVMVLGEPRVEMVAVLKEGRWTREMAKAASARLTKNFGRTYRPEGDLGREMRFVRSPCLRAQTGAGCISREAGMPSGDSHLIRMLDDERMMFLISDGMGSGEAAAKESAAAVRLLARFLSAGVDSTLAIETVNAMLLGSSSEDMFATVDLLVLDLSTGSAEFLKLAACASLIARDGEIFRVEGGRLPLGILEKVQPAVTRVQLQPGDIVLMASDGVMDAVDVMQLYDDLREGAENMPDMAQRVLALAESADHRCRRDDMTAICIRIEAGNALGLAG